VSVWLRILGAVFIGLVSICSPVAAKEGDFRFENSSEAHVHIELYDQHHHKIGHWDFEPHESAWLADSHNHRVHVDGNYEISVAGRTSHVHDLANWEGGHWDYHYHQPHHPHGH
jgi:hypothetical protein